MNREQLLFHLNRLGACTEAVGWVRGSVMTPAALWRSCKRGDWMLWLAAKAGVDRRLVVLVACDRAEPALRYVPAGEDRPRKAIETARAWARREATIEEVRAACASASAYACASACASVYACASVCASVYACAYAYDSSYDSALKLSARLVRAHITWRMVRAAMEANNG